MNQSSLMETHKLAEASMLAALVLVVALLAIYLPLTWFILIALLPVPILIISKRSGIRYAILACLVVALLIGLLSNFVEAGSLLPILILGVVQEVALRKKISATRMVLLSTAAILLSLALVFLLSYFLLGLNLVAEQTKAIKDSLNFQENFYQSLGYRPTSSELQALEKGLKFLPYVIPAFLILLCLIVGGVNFWLTSRILRKLEFEVPQLPEFSCWQWPWYLAWGYILGLIGFFFPKYFGSYADPIYYLSFDLLLVFGALFFIQGASIAVFYFRRLKLAWFFRVLGILILILFPFLIQVLSWVGLLDTWFNYRRLPQRA